MSIHKTTVPFGDKQIEIEIGRYAQQATMAVTARVDETVVLATVMLGKARDDISWFPLSVEYQEKLYAGGKIKGSRWVKRDGRPNDEVVLKGRLIDRTIRPLFPEGFKTEVQVIITVLSADGVNDADMIAMQAVNVALSLSSIPWDGPVVGVRVGYLRDEKRFVVNPSYDERDVSDLDLVVSGTKDAVVMVEAGANEISESLMLEAFVVGQKAAAASIDALADFIATHAQKKVEFVPKMVAPELLDKVKQLAGKRINEFVKAWAQLAPFAKDELVAEFMEQYPNEHTKGDVYEAVDLLMKKEARRMTSQEKKRPDGRAHDEIRPIDCQVSVLPRTHGSAIFQRGSTQALTITTLGSPSLNQLIESMEGEEEKRYIHHYSMPPFSVGEAGRVGWPSRREVGHGALAERALEPVIPSEEEFPYTIHVVSEIMSSNGSTSQASVCGSTLSLMDAGVPIRKPVSGIAMGLIKEGEDYIVLSDIQGLEDFTGDMDFKVAGTKDGITAMQMDIKISGIPTDVLERALAQAHEGRMFILDKMLSALPEPRTQLSKYAPRIQTITIDKDRIGEIIGPGGRVIKAIIAETGAEVDVDDDGHVFITSSDDDAMNRAKAWINDIVSEVEIGTEFTGEVTRVESYGAFVKIGPTKEGLVHVSKMAVDYVASADQLVKLGDIVSVRVDAVDDQGKISLTMLTPEQEEQARQSRPPRSGGGGPRRDFGGRRGGGDRGFDRPRRPFRPRA